MAVHVGGVALCCEHAILGQNTQVFVCWKRSRAVVKTRGKSGIAGCCYVAGSMNAIAR